MNSIERFEIEYQEFHDISPQRRRDQVKEIHALAEFAGKPPEQCDADDFASYLSELQSGGRAASTVRKRGNYIRPFFTWAHGARLVSAEHLMQIQGVSNPRGAGARSTPRPYKRPEIIALWADFEKAYPLLSEKAADTKLKNWERRDKRKHKVRGVGLYSHMMHIQLKAIILLALHCGLRRIEVFRLSVPDVHPENEAILIRGKSPRHAEPKLREVPFTDDCRQAVAEWLKLRRRIAPKAKDHQLWLSLWGDAWINPMWHSRFGALLSKMGSGWSYHRLRHTCATEWLRSGMDLHLVQRLMGHANIRETQSYAEIVNDDIQKAMGERMEDFTRRTGPQRKAA